MEELKTPSFGNLPEDFVGPGGCTSEEECEAFCSQNPQECNIWCQENPEICRRGEGHERIISSAEECENYWYECEDFCAKPENLETCQLFCEENPSLCELLPQGIPVPIPSPDIGVTYFKGVYIILAAQSDTRASITNANQIGANSINLLVDLDVNEEGNCSLSVSNYRIGEAINLAHELGMQVQLSGGFIISELENISQYFESFEDYKSQYTSTIAELAKIAKEYNVVRFEVLREIDVVTCDILAEFEGWEGWWVCWDNTSFMEDFAQQLLTEVKEYYDGKIGIGFAVSNDYVSLPGYEFIGISIYSRDDTFNFSQAALADINRAKKYLTDFNRIEELVLGETSLGGIPEDIELTDEQKKQLYDDFFEATHDEADGYFVFINEPYPDPELEAIAKEWYGRLT